MSALLVVFNLFFLDHSQCTLAEQAVSARSMLHTDPFPLKVLLT